jgi:hypothetical protein
MISVDGIEYSFSRKLPAGAEKCTQLFLLRLLVGTAAIRKGALTVRQRTNYSVFPSVVQSGAWTDAINELNTNYGSSLQAAVFVKRALPDNRVFFRDILNEFSHFFLQSSRGCHIAGFVALYRILERFSYSVPLLYCSTQRDFAKTFEDLKKVFSAQNVGEISFFNKFLRVGGLIDQTVLDSLCEINFTSGAGNESKYFQAAAKCYDKFETQDASRASLGFKFGDTAKLIVAVRNRFFHLLSGGWQENISMTEIWDADEFFEGMNGVFCNFLSVVLVSVLIHKYSD